MGNAYYQPPSFESIATLNGTGSSNTITFSSIPSGFKHLQVRCLSLNTSAGSGNTQMYFTMNGSSSAEYSDHWVYTSGGSVTPSYAVSATYIRLIAGESYGTNGYYTAGILDLLDYGSTTKNKTIRWFGGANGNETGGNYFFGVSSGSWMNTSAVTSISFKNSSNSAFATTAKFALYGIKEA